MYMCTYIYTCTLYIYMCVHAHVVLLLMHMVITLTTSLLQGHSQSGVISKSTVPKAGDCRDLHCTCTYVHTYI